MEGLMILVTFFMTIIIVAFVFILLSIIGQWKMFRKAGKNGWEVLIPIYNQYVLCKIVGVNPIWIAIMFGSILLSVVPILGSIVSMVVSVYFPVLLAVSTAKSFGKDDIWGLGLFFFAPIFYMILGFGSSEYVGPTPMNDAILELFGVKNEVDSSYVRNTASGSTVNTSQSVDSMMAVRFCSACGSKVVEGSTYCGNCGHKI